MKIVVAGASGLIGSALVSALRARGDDVVQLVRRPARAPAERSWDPGSGVLDDDVLAGADAVVNLGGAGLGDRRWSTAYLRVVRESRIGPTSLLARSMARLDDGPQILVQASAVGFYGDRGETIVDEDDERGDGLVPELVEDWEAATAPAARAGVRVAQVRTGIVLARGGALSRLIPLARWGVAGRLGPGTQFWSWISLEDEIRALLKVIDAPIHGPMNLVAPEAVRNAELVATLARTFGRPAPVPVPAWALRVGLGGFASELLASQRVAPSVLLAHDFTFVHPRLTDAIDAVVNPREAPRDR